MNNQSILDTAKRAMSRLTVFLNEAGSYNPVTFKDSALQLGLELVKYGDYIKTTLIIENAVAQNTTKRSKRIDPKDLEGASEEEKNRIEQTPPSS